MNSSESLPQPELHTELWERLSQYHIDDPDSPLPFTKRLASDNDWSHDYAKRVVQEYLRFAFLAQVAGHKVTPSDEVDQAWHLHLIYSRQYWDDFCPNFLGGPLHHGPTKGGAKEDAKYEDWYAKTKESYEKFFGITPPEDIWPPSEVRFGRRFVRADVGRYLIVHKSDFPVICGLTIKLLNLAIAIKSAFAFKRFARKKKNKTKSKQISETQNEIRHETHTDKQAA